LQDSLQISLAGDEVPFLTTDSFLAYLKSTIAKCSAKTASVFAINALIPAASIAAIYPACSMEGFIPFLAKMVRWMLGPSGLVLRVGPGILVCAHLAPRSVDAELVGLQLERSIKRIFRIPAEEQGLLKGTFCFNPVTKEAENSLRLFLSNL
jgi:hypothetical protein